MQNKPRERDEMKIIELGAPAVCGGADTRTDTGAATVAGRCTAVLGCFDGVHTAHAQLIETGRRVAHELGTPLAVWTLRGLSKSGRGVLLGEKEKLEQFRSLGVDAVFISDFSDVRDLSPERFVRDVLIGELNASAVVCGYNFTFGRGAAGNGALLSALMEERGRRCYVMPEVTLGGLHVSSTEIRRLLSAGDVAGAARLLGRRYALHGTVAHGKQNGRLLGFPTANLAVDGSIYMPKKGVYLTDFVFDGHRIPSVTNVGTNPTLGGDSVTVESYILDFSDDIYGVCASVEFIERDRDELRFSSADELREAIAGSVLRRRELAAR